VQRHFSFSVEAAHADDACSWVGDARDEAGLKLCGDCGTWLPRADFDHRSDSGRSLPRSYCYICAARRRRANRLGCTLEEIVSWESIKECWICNAPVEHYQRGIWANRACLDHCHKTGKIRGVLCQHHNTALGAFQDNIELMRKAIDYLISPPGYTQ